MVHVVSASTVKIKPPQQLAARINFTPWDLELLFQPYLQMGLLFSNPGPAHQPISLINSLKASFQRALYFFPPLVGRLEIDKSDDATATTRYFIDGFSSGDDCGALFVHAEADLTVAEILDTSAYVPEIVASFFPLAGIASCETDPPLLGVQVTDMVDGLFVGCSMNHLLGDGTSFWHFINSWAEISRGNTSISKFPNFNRDRLTLDFTGSGSIKISDEYLINGNNSAINSKSKNLVRDKVFHFSRKNVAKLKEQANAEIKGTTDAAVGTTISSLQAVMGLLWRSIIRCRFTSGIGKTTFEMPIGARQRLNPPLPEEYFGNAVFPGIVTVEAGKMMEKGLGWTAWQLNRMVGSATEPGGAEEYYRRWIESPSFLQFNDLPKNHFVLINSPRFDVYGNDFGWGKPVAARGGRTYDFDGRITIYGGVEEGSLEIEACLSDETHSMLANDQEFATFLKSS